MALQALRTFAYFQFSNLYAARTTLCMGDQPVARPLPTHRTTQTRNERTQTSIASSGIRTYDRSFGATEDGSCPRRAQQRDSIDGENEVRVQDFFGKFQGKRLHRKI
jgi:hypothetical protein